MKSIGRFALRYQTLELFQTRLGNRSCARIRSQEVAQSVHRA